MRVSVDRWAFNQTQILEPATVVPYGRFVKVQEEIILEVGLWNGPIDVFAHARKKPPVAALAISKPQTLDGFPRHLFRWSRR
jgi:hypothetical protein